jgi:hypothetical protein
MSKIKRLIDYSLVEKLAHLGCTEYEIAFALGFTPEYFSRRKAKEEKLREAIGKGSSNIKISLRQAQLKIAMPDPTNGYRGNVAMLIWLGKQVLHQSDHVEIAHDQEKPLNVNAKARVDLSYLTDEELEQYGKLAAKLRKPSPEGAKL